MLYPLPVRAALVFAMAASSPAATLVSMIPINQSGGTPSGAIAQIEEVDIGEQDSLQSVPEPYTLPFGLIGMTLLLRRRRTR
jgi:hypothetical protein